MIRVALVTALLGACLDPPDPPPGGSEELRHTNLVVDIDQDGFDDLITIGHDGDPRKDAYVFVDFGGELGPTRVIKQGLRIDDDGDFAWYEATGIAWFTSIDPETAGLYIVTGQDGGVAPDGDHSRYNYVTHLPIAGRQPGTAAHSGHLQADGLGGYATDAPTNVCVRDRAQGKPMVIFGGDASWQSYDLPLDSTMHDDDVEISGIDSQGGVEGLFAIPPSNDPNEPLALMTRDEVYVSSAEISTGSGTKFTLPLSGPRLTFANSRDVRIGDIEGAAWVAGNNNYGGEIGLARYQSGVLTDYELDDMTGMTATDVAIGDLGANGRVYVATIEEGNLYVYLLPDNIPPSQQTIQPVTGWPQTASLTGIGYFDLIALGHFQNLGQSGQSQIYVMSTVDPIQPRRCFYLDTDATLQACP